MYGYKAESVSWLAPQDPVQVESYSPAEELLSPSLITD